MKTPLEIAIEALEEIAKQAEIIMGKPEDDPYEFRVAREALAAIDSALSKTPQSFADSEFDGYWDSEVEDLERSARLGDEFREATNQLQIICCRILADWTLGQDFYGLRKATDNVRAAFDNLRE